MTGLTGNAPLPEAGGVADPVRAADGGSPADLSGAPDPGSAEVGPGEAGERLDIFLAARAGVSSRSEVRRWIDFGRVLVDGQPTRASHKMRAGERVEWRPPPPIPAEPQPEAIPLSILFEDDDLLVIDKPKGLVVHPAPGHAQGTLVNALLHHCPDLPGIGGVRRPGIVHRLDKDTSGVMVVAKTPVAMRALVRQLKERTVRRTYAALVHGGFREDEGTIDAPIGRHPTQRVRMAVVPDGGRPAVTHFRVLERLGEYTWLEARLETGRTHQIRVHLAFIGHPVAGDPIYSRRPEVLGLTSQALHARELSLVHPRTGEPLTFQAPLPEEMRAALRRLGAGEGAS